MTITQISPIAAAMTGGITVTLTGTGFQAGASVFFGSRSATQVTVVSSTLLQAILPAASETGSVNVQVVNPDGAMASLPGGFTYVNTDQGGQAEVLDIQPLCVTEGTPTQIHIRGNNLIAARDQGLFALRGPSQASIAASGFTDSVDPSTGIETLTGTIEVTSNPPLEPLDRLAIQVLASRRPGALTDGIAESSRKMFTVMPQAVPVPLAFTATVSPDGPTLIVVAGWNLEGCTLDLGEQFEVHLQRSDDRMVAGIVSLEDPKAAGSQPQSDSGASGIVSLEDPKGALHVALMDTSGKEFTRYELAVAASSTEAGGEASQNTTVGAPEGPELSGVIPLTLTPVPDQRIIGPTAEDSAVFNLAGDQVPLLFEWVNFEIVIFDITIVLPIVNEVHLIPFFDGGGALESPIGARLGQLFRVRGVGLLVALRIEITIHISVILIIGFIFEIWPFGLFNEFPEFGWAIGSVVIAILIQIDIFINLSFMTALVLPSGRLQVLAAVNLTIGIDFTISSDGLHLNFDPGFTHMVRFRSINPIGGLFPCDGRFQLAEDNGVTVFPDAFGGSQAFYFAREQGRCCAPWSFDLDLVRFAPGGPEETVQEAFQVDFCVRARQSPGLMNIIITSVPPPTGVPPRLIMDVGDSAVLKALAQPVDINGNPTGGPLQDVRDRGYGVEFYVDTPPDVLDPTLLPDGDAFAVLAGSNVIHAAITAIRIGDDPDNPPEPEFTFWPGGVLGFDIARFLAIGEFPRIKDGSLPVTVNEVITTISVTPLLVYRNSQGEVLDAGMEIERYEPFEIPLRTYSLGVKLDMPANVPLPQNLTFRVTGARLLVAGVEGPPLNIPGAGFGGERSSVQDPTRFFTGTLAQVNQQVTITINSRPDPAMPIQIADFGLLANQFEDAGLSKLVPPGRSVGINRDVSLSVNLSAQASNATVSMNPSQLNLKVVNNETFEEYLRVFREVRTILNPPGQIGQAGPTIAAMRGLAADLLNELSGSPSPDPGILIAKGNDLWNLGWQLVQNGFTDDRPLYWARLQAIGAIRAYCRRNDLASSAADTAVAQFEWPSRGLSSLMGTPGSRVAIVTGFDPFALISRPNISNPSGLIALKFKNSQFSSSQGSVEIATAIFPVRYADFDAGMIEQSLGAMLGSIVMLFTFSEGPDRNFYDVERYATRRRGGGRDNNNKDIAVPGPIGPGTANYVESTLPYERVITADIQTRKLMGPTLDETPFVLDQSYILANGQFADPPPNNIGPGSYEKNPTAPPETEVMLFGSGGSFLSNEIFYRTASQRNQVRPSLPSGHIHVPSTGNNPLTTGPRLLQGVAVAIQQFLQNSTQLRSSGDITFPPTVVNLSSQPVTLTVTNDGGDAVQIAAVQIAPPFAVQLPGALPLVIAPAAAISLPCTFTPNMVRIFTGSLMLRGPSGELLLTAGLTGEGIAGPNTPRITGFSPTSGRPGDTVTITGEHLDGAVSVDIGAGPVTFTVVSPTQINAFVSVQATTGLIKVTTPYGIAFSQTSFTILTGGDNASFVTQTPPPTSMTALQSVAVSVTMHNTGVTVWRAGIYALGSQNPTDNLDWGFNRVSLPADVAPGGNATFNFTVTAPVVPRDYNFQWRMNSGAGFFGAASTNVGVAVNPGPGSPPPAPTGLTATVAPANQVNLHWNNVTDAEGYAIDRKSIAGTWTQIGQVASNATSMSDHNLSQGSYVYRVRAFNSSGYSSYSKTASATIGG